jgi:hypothetical protein
MESTMPLAAFLLATLALLAAPGPSNTLFGLAGAQGGLRGAARLLPALVAGYLCAVLPLAFAGAGLTHAWPALMPAIRLLAAAWVAWLAIGLWRNGGHCAATGHARVECTAGVADHAAQSQGTGGGAGAPASSVRARLRAAAGAVLPASARPSPWHGAGSGCGPLPGSHATGRLLILHRAASVWLMAVSAGLAATTLQTPEAANRIGHGPGRDCCGGRWREADHESDAPLSRYPIRSPSSA